MDVLIIRGNSCGLKSKFKIRDNLSCCQSLGWFITHIPIKFLFHLFIWLFVIRNEN